MIFSRAPDAAKTLHGTGAEIFRVLDVDVLATRWRVLAACPRLLDELDLGCPFLPQGRVAMALRRHEGSEDSQQHPHRFAETFSASCSLFLVDGNSGSSDLERYSWTRWERASP